MQSFIGQNPGGYSLIFIVFLIFLEKESSAAVILATFCAYLISVPGDWTLTVLFEATRDVWLSGRTVVTEYVIPWGSLIRPGILLIMMWALMLDTLMDIHRAVKSGRPTFGLVPDSEPPTDPIPSPDGARA